MTNYIISFVIVIFSALTLSRYMKISQRYERPEKKARDLSPWNSLDRGIDPTENGENK
jgi:hypothetical protein